MDLTRRKQSQYMGCMVPLPSCFTEVQAVPSEVGTRPRGTASVASLEHSTVENRNDNGAPLNLNPERHANARAPSPRASEDVSTLASHRLLPAPGA